MIRTGIVIGTFRLRACRFCTTFRLYCCLKGKNELRQILLLCALIALSLVMTGCLGTADSGTYYNIVNGQKVTCNPNITNPKQNMGLAEPGAPHTEPGAPVCSEVVFYEDVTIEDINAKDLRDTDFVYTYECLMNTNGGYNTAICTLKGTTTKPHSGQ
jgi:hypothetical protein